MKASFFVQGVPVPKARPRVVQSRNGKFPIAYTPKETVKWEKTIAEEYKRQCKGIFFDKDIALRFYAEIVCPGNGPLSSIRGDWENYAKSCADALNGVAWHDDAQIVDGRTVKRRAKKGEQCGVYILIEVAQEVPRDQFLFETTPEKVMPWEKTA